MLKLNQQKNLPTNTRTLTSFSMLAERFVFVSGRTDGVVFSPSVFSLNIPKDVLG